MELKDSKCENCKFFMEHYMIQRSRFQALGIGHCTNVNLLHKRTAKFTLHKNCVYWESNEEKVEKENKCINQCLLDMEKQLREIAQILQEYNTRSEHNDGTGKNNS